MNQQQKKNFEKYIEYKIRNINILNLIEFANNCGYRILDLKDKIIPIEIIALINKKDNTIYLNREYPKEISNFSIFYLLSKVYLGKINEQDIYTCIDDVDKEAYELAKTLITPSKMIKETNLDQAQNKAKKLHIPLTILYK